MEVITTKLVLALFILMLAINAATVDEYVDCGDGTDKTIKVKGSLDCDKVRQAAKCSLNETGFRDPTRATDSHIKDIKGQIDKWSQSVGTITCDIDYKSVMEELRVETIKKIDIADKAFSKNFESSSNILKEDVKKGKQNCESVKNFTKTVMNKTGYTDPALATAANVAEFKNQTDTWSQDVSNITCDIDYKALMKELYDEKLKEQKAAENLPLAIPSLTKADIARCIAKMMFSFSSKCSPPRTAIKCAMRIAGFGNPSIASQSNIAALKKQMDSTFASVGVNCEIDYNEIAKEIQNSADGRGRFSCWMVVAFAFVPYIVFY